MLTRSLLYNHVPLDRVLHFKEHFAHMGWNYDVKFDNLTLPAPAEWLDAAGMPEARKHLKRRRISRSVATAAKELIGSAMGLPEVSLIHLCSLYAADNGLFEHAPPPEGFGVDEVPSAFATHTRIKHLVVNIDNLDALQADAGATGSGGEDEGSSSEGSCAVDGSGSD